MAHLIFNLYITGLIAYTLIDLSLTLLNINYGRKLKASVPPYFQNWYTADNFCKSLEYSGAKQTLGIFQSIFDLSVLLVCLYSGFFVFLDRLVVAELGSSNLSGVVYLLSLSILASLLHIPFSFFSQFVIEERYGFNKMTKSIFVKDLVKSSILQILLGLPILWLLFKLIDVLGNNWWIWGFALVAGFQLLLMFLFPVLIAPLFNKFEPLPEGELRDSIIELAKKAQFENDGIFIMDGSKRSAHGNAYFTGFGKYRRIVLYDTLVDSLDSSQVLAVLAHEIGHQKHNHIKKSLLLSLVVMLGAFYVLSLLMNYSPLFEAFGFAASSKHIAFLLFSLVSEPLMFFLSPLFSMLSRRYEYQADRFAVDLVKTAESLKSALMTLSVKSLSNLVPHPLYSFFNYSHPTLSERLPAMEKYAIVSCHANVDA